jgi:hypothetical protein
MNNLIRNIYNFVISRLCAQDLILHSCTFFPVSCCPVPCPVLLAAIKESTASPVQMQAFASARVCTSAVVYGQLTHTTSPPAQRRADIPKTCPPRSSHALSHILYHPVRDLCMLNREQREGAVLCFPRDDIRCHFRQNHHHARCCERVQHLDINDGTEGAVGNLESWIWGESQPPPSSTPGPAFCALELLAECLVSRNMGIPTKRAVGSLLKQPNAD